MRIQPVAGNANLLARTLATRPDLLAAVNGLMAVFVKGGLLDPRLRELARQAAAVRGPCRYCSTLGTDNGPRSPREEVAERYAGALAEDPARVTDELFVELLDHFTREEVVDLTAFVCYIAIGGQAFGAALGLPQATSEEAAAFQTDVAEGRR